MFGKPHDVDDANVLDSNSIDGFFGDEAAAANAIEVHEIRRRVEQVEAQITSQFTSLATYAQISQEQIELARSEARAATERSEQRLTSLVERERTDRISSFTGQAPAGSAPDVTARLDALEHSVAQIRKGLDECLLRQKALADAITTMFERIAPSVDVAEPGLADPGLADPDLEGERTEGEAAPVSSFAPPVLAPPNTEQSAAPISERPPVTPLSGPIADLSLND